MKKLIAVAGLSAAVAIGSLMGAGTASANDAGFIDYVYDEVGYGGSEMLDLGHVTCDAITAGKNAGLPAAGTMGAIGGIMLDSGFTADDAADIVAAAVVELCPSNYDYAMDGVDGASDGGSLYA